LVLIIRDIDYPCSESIKELYSALEQCTIVLVVSAIEDHVLQHLDLDGIIGMIGKTIIVGSFQDAVIMYQRASAG